MIAPPATRREFLRFGLKGAGLLAFARHAPLFLAQGAMAATPAPEKDRTVLVLVQLSGGNDGLNTVVPFAQDSYYKIRPTLGIKAEELLKLNDQVGLHPALAPLRPLMDSGKLATVQNVGYPNPNRSHFTSMNIWEYGGPEEFKKRTGWIGRWFDAECPPAPMPKPGERPPQVDPVAFHVGKQLPETFLSKQPHNVYTRLTVDTRDGTFAKRDQLNDAGTATSLRTLLDQAVQDPQVSYLSHAYLDALVTEEKINKIITNPNSGATYPGNEFAQQLRAVAALVGAGLSTRVYYVSLGGFDTHAGQAGRHAELLGNLAGGLAAFQADLVKRGLADRVLTMTFSEFGRRPDENASQGTDHGTMAPLFVCGGGVKGGVYGQPPLLPKRVKKGQPIEDHPFDERATDFRQVYATIMKNWLKGDPSQIFQAPTATMGFLG